VAADTVGAAVAAIADGDPDEDDEGGVVLLELDAQPANATIAADSIGRASIFARRLGLRAVVFDMLKVPFSGC
jgi:hypothetical protein